MPEFDLAGARKAGYSYGEIADYLAAQDKFDAAGARDSGYSNREIAAHLTKTTLGSDRITPADVRAEASRYGIDPDFAHALITQESGGNDQTRDSPKGAAGIAQVMPDTFKSVMPNGDIRDPWQNLEAGLKYIRQGADKLGIDTKNLDQQSARLLAAGYHQGYDAPDLARGEIAPTSDGLITTPQYADSIYSKYESLKRNRPADTQVTYTAPESSAGDGLPKPQAPTKYIGYDDFIKQIKAKDPNADDGDIADQWLATYGGMTPEKDPGYFGDIGRGLAHSARVTAPTMVGQTAKFFGADELGDKIIKWAETGQTPANTESQVGQEHTGTFSVRGNVYEAADAVVPSIAPGAAGALVGAGVGSMVGPVGAGLGALIGYGVGSIASLPIFYGSQGQQTYEKVYKAQIDAGASPEVAKSEATKAGHLSGGIEAGGELVADVIPGSAVLKPFARAGTKAVGNVVKSVFFPGLKGGLKTVGKIEAGEVATEMAQQAGEAAVEGAYGAGPGATWKDTASVIMPIGLMSLIPGIGGAVAQHMRLAQNAKLLESPDTDPNERTKIALGAASMIQGASPETARAFSLYAADKIQAGAKIEFGNDEIYRNYAAQKLANPVIAGFTRIDNAQTVDEAIAGAAQVATAPVEPVLPVLPEITTGPATQESQLGQVAQDADAALREQNQATGRPAFEAAPNAVQLVFQQAQERSAQEQAQTEERTQQQAVKAQREAETARIEALKPQPTDLPILERLIKREALPDAERQLVLDKGYARLRDDGAVSIVQDGYKARNSLQRQQTPAPATPSATQTQQQSAVPVAQVAPTAQTSVATANPAAIGTPAPASPQAPKIGRLPVTDIALRQLRYFATRGGARIRPIAQAEIDRREEARRMNAESKTAFEAMKDTPSRDLLNIVAAIGGVNKRYALDVAGDKGIRGLGGNANRIFRQQKRNAAGMISEGHGLDEIATELLRQGYMTQAEHDSNGSNIASGMIRDAIAGQLGPITEAQVQKANEAGQKAQQDKEDAEAEIRAAGEEVTPDNVEAAMTVSDAIKLLPLAEIDQLDDRFGHLTNSDEFAAAVINYAKEWHNAHNNPTQEVAGNSQTAGGEEARTEAAAQETAPLALTSQSPEDLAVEKKRADEAKAAEQKAIVDREREQPLTLTPPAGAVTQAPENAPVNQRALPADATAADHLREAARKMDEQNAPKGEAQPTAQPKEPGAAKAGNIEGMRSPVVTPPTQQQIVQVLRDHPLIQLRERVKSAYLVGSQATGNTRLAEHGKSDVDVLLEVVPRGGMTASELTNKYQEKLQQYFVTNNIRGVRDDIHPQWEGHRVDVYFTYDASKEDDRPKLKLSDQSPGPPSEGRGVSEVAKPNPLRPLVEALIKRRAASKQIGSERTVNNAIDKAKAALNGEAISPKWFANLAKVNEKRDPDTAKILSDISEAIRETPSGTAMLSRNTGGTMQAKDVNAVASIYRAKLPGLPPVHVMQSVKEAPEALRDQIKEMGAEGDTAGAWHNNEIYLFADNLKNPDHAAWVILHESTHHGLRNVFGNQLNPVLMSVYMKNQTVREAAKRMREKNEGMSIVLATEEALANMGGDNIPQSVWQQLIAGIRNILRKLGLKLELTDGDVRALVNRALDFVKTPQKATDIVSGTALSEADQTQTPDSALSLNSLAGTLDKSQSSKPVSVEAMRSNMTGQNPLTSARNLMDDLTHSDRTLNRVISKFNTPFHIAETQPEFRPVYNETQNFLHDVSRVAIESADLAPDLLPRIEKFADYKKTAPSDADLEATQAAIHAGTLYGQGNPLKGVLWTDDELRGNEDIKRPFPPGMPKLTDKQIGLYHQHLDSVAHSMEEHSKSLIWRIASQARDERGRGIKLDPGMALEDMANAAREEADNRIAGIRLQSEALTDTGTETSEKLKKLNDQYKELNAFKDSVTDIEKNTTALKEHGYSPLTRFGQYAVNIASQNEKGEWQEEWFGRFDTQTAATIARKGLEADPQYKGMQITSGVMNPEMFKLFQGLNLDALQLFADHMRDDQGNPISSDPIMQQAFRVATAERSVMKRQIHRKGTPGYSTDLSRILSQFTTSTARSTSTNYHGAAMLAAAQGIKAGDLQGYATRYVRYVNDPAEEAQALRGFMANYYILGSLAFGAVNMTQPILQTAPYLTEHTSWTNAMKQLGIAAVDYMRGPQKLGREEREAYARGVKDGTIAPQEIHQIRAEGQASMFGQSPVWQKMNSVAQSIGIPMPSRLLMRKLSFIWGSIYSLTEQWNRGTTFLAAYRIAKANGEADPYAFATKAVDATQGVYNKGNRPEVSRGQFGSVIMTFKQFNIAYLEQAKRLYATDKKAFAVMMLTLMVLAGMEGLPFSEDISDLLDTVGEWMGYATNSKKKLRKLSTDILGKDIAEIMLHGFSAIPGMPIDVSQRMGMQNIIPGSAVLKSSEPDKTRDILELLGPAATLFKNAGTSIQGLATGKPGETKALLPNALQNFIKGVDMAETGVYKDTKGRKVMDVDGMDAFAKMISFQPANVAKENRIISQNMQDVAMQKVIEDSIAGKLAQAIVEKNPEMRAEAIQRLRQWNSDNPELPVRITPSQIQTRVKAMLSTREQRFIKSAAPEIRQGIRQEFRETRP